MIPEHAKLSEVLLKETPRDEQLLADYNEAITSLVLWIDFWAKLGNPNMEKLGAETIFMLGYHAGRKVGE